VDRRQERLPRLCLCRRRCHLRRFVHRTPNPRHPTPEAQDLNHKPRNPRPETRNQPPTQCLSTTWGPQYTQHICMPHQTLNPVTFCPKLQRSAGAGVPREAAHLAAQNGRRPLPHLQVESRPCSRRAAQDRHPTIAVTQGPRVIPKLKPFAAVICVRSHREGSHSAPCWQPNQSRGFGFRDLTCGWV
jgi:hypothetical protein